MILNDINTLMYCLNVTVLFAPCSEGVRVGGLGGRRGLKGTKRTVPPQAEGLKGTRRTVPPQAAVQPEW